eukprot:TRINITY_DN4791_c0_g2_i1.p2 TRINITY_DN4791_c0_g2~~TRINITY_DN4791_c0_g2_i1.p2  ORF type:complete len:469 (+),score=90.84 TRINITY_DN4791_c0_g2_i1:33-1409(+)
MLTKCAVLSALLATAAGARPADEVTALPGWNAPLPSKHYSGFLNVDKVNGRALHYYFVEAHEDPQSAPVLLWMNGGPGCSSLDGLFYEHGPLLVNENGTALVANPYAWSTLANVLYLEAPAGVGFSYSNTTSDYKTGDNKTAYDNFAAVKEFFSFYPEYQKNEFYVSGESYGGIYVPTLSYTIFNHASEVNFNMKGFLVGNGVFGECEEEKNLLSKDSSIEFLHGHGIISEIMYREIVKACNRDIPDPECQILKAKASSFASNLNMYDAYRDCWHGKDLSHISHKNPFSLRELFELPRPAHPSLGEQVPCIDSRGGTIYLNRNDVKKALHVEQSPNSWAICSNLVHYENDGVYKDGMVPLYQKMSPTYRIVVYNGDVDPGCNFVMNEVCVASINKNVTNAWRTWMFDNENGQQVGGWTTEYEGDLHFITVHGAGHMSPQWRPNRVHTFLKKFLKYRPL